MASMDFGGAFDELMDSDVWVSAASVFAGYLAPNIVANVVEGRGGVDLPNELYGVATALGAEAFTDQRMVTVGAGVYTTDQLAQRLGVKNTVTRLGGA